MSANYEAEMSKEISLQKDMFSGELRDTRSAYRKRQDRQRQQPRQAALFSVRETVQIGVNPRPWLKDMARPTLALEIQDMRTDEEKERERRREAEALTAPMFEDEAFRAIHELVEPVGGIRRLRLLVQEFEEQGEAWSNMMAEMENSGEPRLELQLCPTAPCETPE